MTPEALLPVLLAVAAGALHLARDMVRQNAVRTAEEAHRRMLVDLMGRCGPDSQLVDRRSDGAELTVRSGTPARSDALEAVRPEGGERRG
ncbi:MULTISPECIES: hypothetical protein [unclassified Streptomyces]|uniref:hypothetical protein n=1 Tax=unclassified Streptomyces TaxID=2593676 RepID=UPI0035D6C0FF